MLSDMQRLFPPLQIRNEFVDTLYRQNIKPTAQQGPVPHDLRLKIVALLAHWSPHSISASWIIPRDFHSEGTTDVEPIVARFRHP
jgi:hypothetical protein